MKIFIDADGCPVVNITVKVAKKYNIKCVLICDTAHIFDIPDVETITVDKGADSVDFKLVNMIQERDIAVTQDYGLAAMCLAKKSFVLNQNGLEYTNDNISSLLESRAISKKIKRAGGRLKGPKKRTDEDDIKFEKCLIKIIETALRKPSSN